MKKNKIDKFNLFTSSALGKFCVFDRHACKWVILHDYLGKARDFVGSCWLHAKKASSFHRFVLIKDI